MEKQTTQRWRRKKHLCERYGGCTPRTIERMTKDGRLPPPEYPFGNKIPFWDEAALDEHDRAAVVAARIKRSNMGKVT